MNTQLLNGLVVSVFFSHAAGHGFTSQPGHTKDYHKMVQTTSLFVCVGIGQCSPTVLKAGKCVELSMGMCT